MIICSNYETYFLDPFAVNFYYYPMNYEIRLIFLNSYHFLFTKK
jgi:hypothetical protein